MEKEASREMTLKEYVEVLPTCHAARKEYDQMTTPQSEEQEPSVFSFAQALNKIKFGKRLQRTGWNGKGMYVELQKPDANSKMSLPYIYMKTADDKLVPWLASQTDILATDWQVTN